MTETATTYHLVRPLAHRRAARPRRAAAARRRPPRRPAAGAGRTRHRQDHDPGRGDRAPHRRGHPPRPDPGADLLAQGGRAAPRPGHRPRRPHDVGEHRLDVPLLRLRADPPLRTGRALRRPAAAAVARPSRTSCCASCCRTIPSRCAGPTSLRVALGTRGFAARGARCAVPCAREGARRRRAARSSGSENGLPEFVAAGAFLEQYLTILDDRGAVDYSDLIRRATIEADRPPRRAARARYAHVFVDEYQDTDSGQVALLRAIAGDGPRPRRGGRPAPVDLRVPRRGGARHPRLPDRVPAAPTAALPRWWRSAPPGGSARASSPPPSGSPSASACRAASPSRHVRRSSRRGPWSASTATAGSIVRTFDSDRAEAEHLADLLRRAHLEDGIAWDEMAVLVRSGRQSIPPLRRSLGAAGVPVEVASDEVPLVRDPAALPLIDALRVVLNLDNDATPTTSTTSTRLVPRRCSPARSAGSTPATYAASPGSCVSREKAAAPRRGAAARALARAGPAARCSTPHCSTGCRVPRSTEPGRWPSWSAGPARSSTTARPPRSCSGRSGPGTSLARTAAPLGRARRRRRAGAHTATSTRSAPCSRRPPGPRRPATTSASGSSWPRWSPSRSRPTPSPSAAPAAPPYAC